MTADCVGVTSGTVYLVRYGNTVRFNAYGVSFSNINTNIYTLPDGFRPDSHTMLMQAFHLGQTSHSRVIVSATTGAVQPVGGTNNTAAYISLVWTTDDAWPATLPGVAG